MSLNTSHITKRFFVRLLTHYVLLQVATGCFVGVTPTYKAAVTVTLAGRPKTYSFTEFLGLSDRTLYLIRILKGIEKGKTGYANLHDLISGTTPLLASISYAMEHGDTTMTRYLLVHGADPNLAGQQSRPLPMGRMPSFGAVKGTLPLAVVMNRRNAPHFVELCALLLAYGAQVNKQISVTQAETSLSLFEAAPDGNVVVKEDAKSVISKASYLTAVAKALLKETQHKPLDPDFVAYVKDKIEADLVNQLSSRVV